MSTEGILKVQIYVLKVNIHCDGCEKKVRKILRNIDGVCQIKINAAEGKVTVSSLVDADTIIKKMNKAGKPTSLWGAKPELMSQPQNLELHGGGNDQPKDSESRGQSSAEAMNRGSSDDAEGVSDVRGVDADGAKDGETAMPQQLPQLQMKGMKIPPQFMNGGKMPPFPIAAATSTTTTKTKKPMSVKFNLPKDEFDDEGSELDDFEEDEEFNDYGLVRNFYNEPKMMTKPMAMSDATVGNKMCGMGGVDNGGKMARGGANEISMQIKGMANNGGWGKKDVSVNQNHGGGGSQGNIMHSGGKSLLNAKGGANQVPIQRKMFVGGPMSGSLPPQQACMIKPPNMMGGAGLPTDMSQMDPSGPMGAAVPCAMGQTCPGGPIGGGMPTGMGQMGPGGSMGSMPVANHPHMSGMQPPASGSMSGMPNGGMPGAAFYQGGGSDGGGLPSGPQMMMQTTANAGNPMAQHQQYMGMQQQQQQQMMMNGRHHGHHGGHGAALGYPPTGYGYGYSYGRPPIHYPSYPEPYNIFSDENPNNSCSVM